MRTRNRLPAERANSHASERGAEVAEVQRPGRAGCEAAGSHVGADGRARTVERDGGHRPPCAHAPGAGSPGRRRRARRRRRRRSSPAPAAHAQTGTTQTLAAADVKALIASAPRVDLVDVTIVGDLDLTDLGTVKVPLRCTRCHIEGSVLAPDVTFARQVDLDGVTISGRADLRGAVFEGPAPGPQ